MNNKIKLYIDFDGVILDTTKYSYSLLQKQLGINLFKYRKTEKEDERITNFFKNIDWYDLLMNSEEINDSFDHIKRLQKSSYFDVSILTHVNSEHEAEYKNKLLNLVLPGIPVITVPREIDKNNAVPAYNAVLVDDYIVNLEKWKENGGIAIKFSDGNKNCDFLKITSLDQIFELQSAIKSKILAKKKPE